MIRQGDVFWLDFEEPADSGPGYRRPFVVVQNDVYNKGAIRTAVVCAITANAARARDPGNVPLEAGEADLPKRSVVNVSQLFTVGKVTLTERIGTLSRRRVRDILGGIALLLEPREVEDGA